MIKKLLLSGLLACGAMCFAEECENLLSTHNGLLCSIEGIDGSGKTTLIQNLCIELKKLNFPIIATKEPGGTELGKSIRAVLNNRTAPTCLKAEFLLFTADRAQHFNELVIPQLKAGNIVLSDRMADSSMVYQGFLKGLSFDMIKTMNSWCMESIQPDLVIYLKINAEDALNRIKIGRGILNKFEEEFQDRMHILIQGFDCLFKNQKNVIIINALDSPENITQKALQAILEFYSKKNYVSKSTDATQFTSSN